MPGVNGVLLCVQAECLEDFRDNTIILKFCGKMQFRETRALSQHTTDKILQTLSQCNVLR